MEIVPFPVIITKEGKWFVACCPILDLATQGRTEKEVKENMKDLINEYMSDPDTPKPEIETIMSASVLMTSIPVRVEGVSHSKTSSSAAA
jgi:predicted RNase H-like HicB family nuclease